MFIRRQNPSLRAALAAVILLSASVLAGCESDDASTPLPPSGDAAADYTLDGPADSAPAEDGGEGGAATDAGDGGGPPADGPSGDVTPE